MVDLNRQSTATREGKQAYKKAKKLKEKTTTSRFANDRTQMTYKGTKGAEGYTPVKSPNTGPDYPKPKISGIDKARDHSSSLKPGNIATGGDKTYKSIGPNYNLKKEGPIQTKGSDTKTDYTKVSGPNMSQVNKNTPKVKDKLGRSKGVPHYATKMAKQLMGGRR
jgi:hypothetical protein